MSHINMSVSHALSFRASFNTIAALVLKVTFGFIKTALSILSKVYFRIYPTLLGEIEQPFAP